MVLPMENTEKMIFRAWVSMEYLKSNPKRMSA